MYFFCSQDPMYIFCEGFANNNQKLFAKNISCEGFANQKNPDVRGYRKLFFVDYYESI